MQVRSFSRELRQESDLDLPGLRVQQLCSTVAMGYAMQVMDIFVLLMAIMGYPAQPQ